MTHGILLLVTLRRTAIGCCAALALLLGIAALAAAGIALRPQLLRPLLERVLAPRGGSATLAGLNLARNPLSLTLSGLAIAGPPKEGDLLRLDHLRVEPNPGRIFHGGPWFRRIEARGLVVERSRPRETEGPPDLTPLTRLFDIEELSLTDARLRLALPTGNLAVDGLRLRLTPGEGGIRRFRGDGVLTFRRDGSLLAGGTIAARGKVTPGPAIEVDLELGAARLDLPWLAGDVSGQTALRVTRRKLQAEGLRLTMPRARLRQGPPSPSSLGPIRLDAAWSSTLDGRDPLLEVVRLDVGGLLLAKGRWSGPTLDRLSGAMDGSVPRFERVKALLAPFLPGRLTDLDLSGELPFRLRLAVRGTVRAVTLDLLPRDLLFSWPDLGLGGRFGGSLRAESTLEGWRPGTARLNGTIRGTGRLERRPLAVRLFRFNAPFDGEFAALTSPGWHLSAGAGDLLYDGKPLPLGTVEIRGSAAAADGSLRIEGLDVVSETVGRLTGALGFHGKSLDGTLSGRGLPAAALISLAGVLTGDDWNGWSPGGAVNVTARIEPKEDGPRVAATVALEQIGFGSPAGDLMGRNLSGRVELEARPGPRPRLTANLAMGVGEALWGTVYLNLAQDPLDLHVAMTRTGPEEYEDLLLEGGLAGFGRIRLGGKARREGGRWRHRGELALSEARLGPIFRTFFRDPLAASNPDLAKVRVDGSARLNLSFSGLGEAADLNGRLRVRSGDVRREGEPPILSGLDIDLPIAYSLGFADPGHARPIGSDRWGRLSLKELRLAGQELGPLERPVILVPNRLYVGGDLDASLFGARLHLRRIEVENPLSAGFRVNLAARLDGLDLSRLAGKGLVLEGHLGGVLDPVHIGRERLTAEGELTGDLFGGRMDVRRLTVDRPFGPGREIGADVNVRLLDLERLSAALNVGRITGRLSGSIEGLRVAYGQPVAFHLKMESVPAKGVTQAVNLKAVNSISLLSTGSALGGFGVSAMTMFFREFPYEKIGIECALKNDVFTVRGLIHEDGLEYLVKRRFFGGINVINRNPENRIGFSDMLERSRRVTGERSP